MNRKTNREYIQRQTTEVQTVCYKNCQSMVIRLDVFFILVVGEGKNVEKHCHIGTFFLLVSWTQRGGEKMTHLIMKRQFCRLI